MPAAEPINRLRGSEIRRADPPALSLIAIMSLRRGDLLLDLDRRDIE
jgi:hypothetical protein